jgi:hypothetical protein
MPNEQELKLPSACPAENTLASEFPELYAWFSVHPVSRPQLSEQ